MESTLEDKELIGRGSYGEVFKATLVTRTKVATKTIHDTSEDAKKEIERELEMLKTCKHTNIVRFLDTILENGKLVIIMEYAECGSLKEFLHGKDGKVKLNAAVVARLNWMHQLANGLAYLHDKNIVHRDIKPANLVLTDNYKTLKICDFGLVKELATNNTELRGTFKYMAPEVTRNDGYTTKCDVFSFGIVLWEVMSNKKPFYEFEGLNGFAIQTKINEGERPDVTDVKPYKDIDHIKRIMEQCWGKNPDSRPTMKGVAFILSIDPSSVNSAKIEGIKPLPLTRDGDFTNYLWMHK